MPPHRGPVDIDKLILPRQILHARDLIGEGIVSSHPPVVVWPVQQPSSAIGSAAITLVGRRQEGLLCAQSWKDLDRPGVPRPSMDTTMKPSSASAWRSPCAVAHEREPTLPDCGPGELTAQRSSCRQRVAEKTERGRRASRVVHDRVHLTLVQASGSEHQALGTAGKGWCEAAAISQPTSFLPWSLRPEREPAAGLAWHVRKGPSRRRPP